MEKKPFRLAMAMARTEMAIVANALCTLATFLLTEARRLCGRALLLTLKKDTGQLGKVITYRANTEGNCPAIQECLLDILDQAGNRLPARIVCALNRSEHDMHILVQIAREFSGEVGVSALAVMECHGYSLPQEQATAIASLIGRGLYGNRTAEATNLLLQLGGEEAVPLLITAATEDSPAQEAMLQEVKTYLSMTDYFLSANECRALVRILTSSTRPEFRNLVESILAREVSEEAAKFLAGTVAGNYERAVLTTLALNAQRYPSIVFPALSSALKRCREADVPVIVRGLLETGVKGIQAVLRSKLGRDHLESVLRDNPATCSIVAYHLRKHRADIGSMPEESVNILLDYTVGRQEK